MIVSTKKTNAYDMTAYVLIPDNELSSPTSIDCVLRIPNVYDRKKTIHYYPGKFNYYF